MDEATANVDTQTERIMQNLILNEFKNSTVLSIAHRLNIVADYDKVITMAGGKLKEFKHPFELLCKDPEND